MSPGLSCGGPDAAARQAGWGVVWLTGAKLYFMATGLLLLLILPGLFKKFAGAEHVKLYGDYRTVLGLVNWFNMVLIGGTIQAVSKFISEKEERAFHVKWTTLALQAVIGGSLSLALFLGAEAIAGGIYDDPPLAFCLKLASPIVLLYALYAVIIGCLNGLRRFHHQAMMDILFATLKVGLTIAFVAAGLAIAGAIGAFLVTAAVLLVLSSAVLGRRQPGERVGWQRILSFEWKTLLFAFLLNGMLNLDLQMLKALVPEALDPEGTQAGIYAASVQLGQIPYVATISVAFVVFPLISRATFEQDLDRARHYVRTTNRYVLIALAGLVLPMAANAASLLGLIYPREYLDGVPLFELLCVAYLFFAMMVVNANVLTGSGRPLLSVLLFAVGLGLAAALNGVLIPAQGAYGAAAAMCAAMAAGMVCAGLLCFRAFRTFLPWATPLRVALAVGAAWALGRFVVPERAGLTWFAVRGAAQLAVYAVMLLLLRELTVSELKRLVLMRGARR